MFTLQVCAPGHSELKLLAALLQQLHSLSVRHCGKWLVQDVAQPLHEALLNHGVEEGQVLGTVLQQQEARDTAERGAGARQGV